MKEGQVNEKMLSGGKYADSFLVMVGKSAHPSDILKTNGSDWKRRNTKAGHSKNQKKAPYIYYIKWFYE